jgi:DNA-binding transcriptional LysR family regulator
MVMDVHGRDLRYFVAVAEDLHFTRAAERLFISQPALSKQIRMLERQLGAPLFDRGRDGVRLTPVGEALLPHARAVLSAWDRGWTEAEQAKGRQQATLVAGMSTSPGRGGLLAAIRSRFTALHPAATVLLRQVSWDDPTAGLADGTVDVAFVWLPLPDPARYQWTVVAVEPRLVAMSDSHPLASCDSVEMADLLDEPFLALPRSAGPLRDYWLATDARGGRPPRIGVEIASTEEAYEALADGRGVCLLAAGNAPLITLGGVTTRPVNGLSPSQLALAWHHDDTRPLVLDYARASRQAILRHLSAKELSGTEGGDCGDVPLSPTPGRAGGAWPSFDGDQDFGRLAFCRRGEQADLARAGGAEDGEGPSVVGAALGRVESLLGGGRGAAEAEQDARS